eukprot:865345-Rhodomonas_salina.1
MPRRFWPWAVTHWHRTYAYWVKKTGKTGWDSLPSHTLNQDFERDLTAPWGPYVIGHLSREHPLVKEDTTHEDRALEGAFLGCQGPHNPDLLDVEFSTQAGGPT